MAIVIDVTGKINKFEGPIKRATDLVSKLEKSIDKATRAMERLADAAAKVQPPNMGNGRGGYRGGGGGGGGTAPGLRHPSVATPMDTFRMLNALAGKGPSPLQPARNAALGAAYKYYAGLAKQGNPIGMRALVQLAPHLHALANPKAPPVPKIKPPPKPKKGFGGLAMQALMTSRFGVSGDGGVSFMPLIGRTVAALSSLGPAGIAAAAGLTALTAQTAVVVHAIQSIGGFATRMAQAGTTPGTQGILDRLGAMFGTSGSQMAQQFAGNISHGVGAGIAANMGINPYSGFGGDQDIGAKLAKAAYNIANSSKADARWKAINLGMPELANLRYLNKDNKKDLFNRGRGYSEGEMRTSVNGQYAIGKLHDSFERLMNKLAIRFAPLLIKIMDGISNMLDNLAKAWDNLPEGIKKVIIGAAGLVGLDDTNDKLAKANHDQVNALNANTRALNGMRETIGGGQRAQKVLPHNIQGGRLADPSYRIGLEGGIA